MYDLLKKLVIIRHGEDDKRNHGHLADWDVGRIQILAKNLKPHIVDHMPNQGVMFFSSTEPRAWDTALVLRIHLPEARYPEAHEVLWSENKHREDFPKALEFVRQKNQQLKPFVIILVTHEEYADGFLSYFCREEFNHEIQTPRIGKGEAIILDLETKTTVHLK